MLTLDGHRYGLGRVCDLDLLHCCYPYSFVAVTTQDAYLGHDFDLQRWTKRKRYLSIRSW